MAKPVGGKMACAVFLIFGTVLPAQTFVKLVDFNRTNGANPSSVTSVQGADGGLYGTTRYGGNVGCSGSYGCGTIFKITPRGALTTLYSFGISDGAFPAFGLVLATDGNFYGTTEQGGASSDCYQGCGTIFRITPQGSLTTLYSFSGSFGLSADVSGLIEGADGNFYGTVESGGAGYGSIFKITPQGRLTTLLISCGSKPWSPQS